MWFYLVMATNRSLATSSYIFEYKKFPILCTCYYHPFAHKQQIVRLPDQRLKFPSESQRRLLDLQVPWNSGANSRAKYDSSSSTRYCLIPRPPGQRILFEQQLMDFKKHYHGGIPILVVIPVSNSEKLLADTIKQLLHFAEIIGPVRIFFSFGIAQSLDDTYYQIYEITDALRSIKIVNRVQFPVDLDGWTRRMLVEYMNDFKIAVILRGVICAIDLVHLVIQAVENNADLTCSLDIKFDSGHRISTTSSALDFTSGTPLSTKDLLHASTLIQSRSCESSVQVLSFISLHLENACILQNILSNYTSDKACHMSPKIMISPSIKSSADLEDFHLAIQLRIMNFQEYNDDKLKWKENY